jgi:hypothetical protein
MLGTAELPRAQADASIISEDFALASAIRDDSTPALMKNVAANSRRGGIRLRAATFRREPASPNLA